MFVAGASKLGHEPDQVSRIFDLVAKFAGYGFNRAHAACYGLISYQAAFLKANYPIEFITASLNLDIDDTDKLNLFIQEAKNMNIEILPPDINKSQCFFTIEDQKIRYGLAALKNVGQAAVLLMIQERDRAGEFIDIFDFTSRVDQKILNKRQMESLVKAGAFDVLYHSRHSLFQAINTLSSYNSNAKQSLVSQQINLFGDMQIRKPEIKPCAEWSPQETIKAEFEAFGLYLREHPLSEFADILEAKQIKTWQYIQNEMSIGVGTVSIAAVPLSSKTRSSQKGRYVTCLMSDCFGNFEISIFNDKLLENSLDFIKNNTPILIEADVKKDEGGVRIAANKIIALDALLIQGFKNLKLWIDHAEAVAMVRQYIGTFEPGQVKIELALGVANNQQVVIELPQKYNISIHHKKMFEDCKGVCKVELY
jgi:DNA polymerase-3 subunit alpha